MTQIYDSRLNSIEKAKITVIDGLWLIPAAVFALLGVANSSAGLFAFGWWLLLFGAIPRALARSRIEAPAKYGRR